MTNQNLSSDQFRGFHGTAAKENFRVVRPARSHGKGSVWNDTGYQGQEAHNHAFATLDENTAWGFANDAYENKVYEGKAGRARVHTVEEYPSDPALPGVFNASHPNHRGGMDLAEYVAPRFKVTGRLDIAPGRQGTFPQEDWNKYKAKDVPLTWDANHPKPGDDQAVAKTVNERRAQRESGLDVFAYIQKSSAEKFRATKPEPQIPGQRQFRTRAVK